MFSPNVAVPIPVHHYGIDCSNDLIEDSHNILLGECLPHDILLKIALILISDESEEFLIGYFGLNFQEILLEG
jgi:hypothetical protein